MAIYIKKTNRDAELALIAALQLEIDLLLQDETIDPSIKNIVLQDLALALDTIQQDAMVGSNARLYLLGVQNGVKKKLAGELGYSPSAVGSAVKNAFGRYAPEEIAWMVNETLRKNAQLGNSGIYEPTYDAPTQLGLLVYVFNPALDDTKIYKIAGTVPDKLQAVKAFSTYLLNLLLNANDILSNADNALHGWDTANNKHLGQWLQLLTSAGTGSDVELNSQILEMGNIINLLKNSNLLAMYEDNFLHWLEGHAPEKESDPVATSPTIQIGDANVPTVDYTDEYANSLIKSKNWKLIKEGDTFKAYLIGGDGIARPVSNQLIINIDPTDRSTWKRAVITDADGVVSYGDLGSDAFIQTLTPGRWTEIQEAIRLAHKDHFGSEVNATDKGLGRYIDLSNFFIGSEPIIYQLGVDPATDPLWIDWDALGNMDNFVFNGNTDASASGASTEGQYLAAKGDPGDITLIPDFTEDIAKERFGGNSDDTGDINLKGWRDPTFSKNLNYTHGHLSDAIIKFVYLQIKYSVIEKSTDTDKDSKLNAIALEILSLCPNFQQQVRVKGGESDIDLGEAMIKQIENDRSVYPSILKAILVNPDMLDAREGVVSLLQQFISSKKQGGALKAKFGATLPSDSTKNNTSSKTPSSLMEVERGDLEAGNPTDERTKTGMNALIASAIFDLVDLVTPNNNRRAGRVIGLTTSAASTAADIVAASNLDMTPGQKALLFGSDALSMGLSAVPYLSKIDKIERLQAALGAKKLQIAMGMAGLTGSTVGTLFTAPGAADAVGKILEGKTNDLTAQDLHALVTLANLLISGTKGISSIAHGVRATPIKASDEYVYIDTKGPDGRKATRVTKSDLDALDDLVEQELDKENIKFRLFKRIKKRKELVSDILADGKSVETTFRGYPKTKPSLEYDNAKLSKTHAYQTLKSSVLKPSVVKNPSMFNLKDAPYFGLWKGFDWDFNLFKAFKGVEPHVRTIKTPKNGDFTAYEVPLSEFDDAVKLYLPKVKKGESTAASDEVVKALFGPTGIPAGTKVELAGNMIIYAIPAPTRRAKGGRLQRLNMYLTLK